MVVEWNEFCGCTKLRCTCVDASIYLSELRRRLDANFDPTLLTVARPELIQLNDPLIRQKSQNWSTARRRTSNNALYISCLHWRRAARSRYSSERPRHLWTVADLSRFKRRAAARRSPTEGLDTRAHLRCAPGDGGAQYLYG